MVKRKEKTVIKNEEGVDPKRPRRSRRSSAGGGASPTKTRDGFYEFKPLMAFLISHLNWGYKPSKNKLKEWDYIIGDSEKGQDGEYMNDFFHEEEEVIDYCIKNNFKEKYAHLLSEADNPTMYSTEEVENEEDGDLEPPSKDKPSREFEAKTASKARLKKQAANKNDNIDTVEKSSEEQPRQKLGTKTSRLKRSKIKAEEAENDPVEESNEEQPRQKSGANRPKRKHLKNKAENEENDLVEESREKKPRRTSRAKRPTRSQPKIESENESDSDFDSNESSEELPRKRRGATKTGAKHDGGRGPVQERTCLHCNKVFSTKDGMKYHVGTFQSSKKSSRLLSARVSRSTMLPFLDHFVCRIDECSDPVLVEKATQKRGRGKSSDSNSKRFRGTLEERTCPNCGRVFTSAHGMQYHSSKFNWNSTNVL